VDGFVFAKLVLIILCDVQGIKFPICVVHRLDAPSGPRRAKDIDLGFYRLCSRPETQVSTYEFIFAQSVVRGALLVEDYERANDYLVIDLVDSDMFSRCKDIFRFY
jgi:hypothetical protein